MLLVLCNVRLIQDYRNAKVLELHKPWRSSVEYCSIISEPHAETRDKDGKQ
jgi:hypothetical protein